MGWNPVKDAKKWFDKVGDEGQSKINWIKDESKNQVNWIHDESNKGVNRIKDAGNEAEKKVNDALIREVPKFFEKELPKAITKEIPKLLEDAVNEIAKLGQSEVYKRAASVVRTAHKKLGELRESKPNLVGYIDAQAFILHIGPTKLTYSKFYARAEEILLILDRMANDPPKIRRSTIIASMKATSPDKTDLGFSVNFALVAGSDALGGGFALPAIPLPLLTEIADWALKEIGVPE